MSGTDTPPVRVFLVEDSPIVRLRLAEALTIPGTIEVVGEADSEAEAVAALRRTPWNALILDLTLKQGSGASIVIFGSGTIVQQLTNEGLIDEYVLTVTPVILGTGKSLFKDVNKLNLKLLGTRSFNSGNVLANLLKFTR